MIIRKTDLSIIILHGRLHVMFCKARLVISHKLNPTIFSTIVITANGSNLGTPLCFAFFSAAQSH
jgi:hypothetical protein